MATSNTEEKSVVFRRIGGRVVPIRVNPSVNIGIGGQAPGATTGKRGPYKTRRDRQNEARRERYAIRKKIAADKGRERRGKQLFGIKQLNIADISAGAGTAALVTLGAFKGRKGIMKMLTKVNPEGQKKLGEYIRLRKGHRAQIGAARAKHSQLRKNLKDIFSDVNKRYSKDMSILKLPENIKKAEATLGKQVTKANKEATEFIQRNAKHFKRRKRYKSIAEANRKYGTRLDYSLGAAAGAGSYASLQTWRDND